jgi:hypothetical protein
MAKSSLILLYKQLNSQENNKVIFRYLRQRIREVRSQQIPIARCRTPLSSSNNSISILHTHLPGNSTRFVPSRWSRPVTLGSTVIQMTLLLPLMPLLDMPHSTLPSHRCPPNTWCTISKQQWSPSSRYRRISILNEKRGVISLLRLHGGLA